MFEIMVFLFHFYWIIGDGCDAHTFAVFSPAFNATIIAATNETIKGYIFALDRDLGKYKCCFLFLLIKRLACNPLFTSGYICPYFEFNYEVIDAARTGFEYSY